MDPKARALDRDILSAVRRYASADSMPDREFDRLALRVFAYQYEKNRFYRRFCDIEGKNPSVVRHWKDVPAMPAQGFKELVLTTFPVRRSARRFRTSGTTRDSRGVHWFETLALYDAAIVPPFRRFLLPGLSRIEMFFLMPSPDEVRDSSLSYMMGVVRKKLGRGAGKFYVKNGNVLSEELARGLSRAKRPVLVLSTAFSLKIFLDFLRARKMAIRLPAGSRVMETGGFKGRVKAVSKAGLYRGCERFLGVPARFCASEYGMTELTSQFYDETIRKGKSSFVKIGPAWMRTVVADPRTGREAKAGRPGILRHYDLANRGSVMAIETEDLGRTKGGGFELLGRAPGAASRGCSLSYEALLRG